jgi:hypothetical protein
MTNDGRLAAVGSAGRVAVRDVGGQWLNLGTLSEATLRGVWLSEDTDEIVAVGDRGTLVEGTLSGGLKLVELSLEADLLAITSHLGMLVVVGDNGRVARRVDGEWQLETIPGYRSRGEAIFAAADGGPVRVVGRSTFIVGPLLHYSLVDAPVRVEGEPYYRLKWDWDGGADHSYNSMTFYDFPGNDLWSLTVDGTEKQVLIPDLTAIEGLVGLGTGDKRLDFYRVLNPNFDMDYYSARDFSVYRRTTWTLTRTYFTAP